MLWIEENIKVTTVSLGWKSWVITLPPLWKQWNERKIVIFHLLIHLWKVALVPVQLKVIPSSLLQKLFPAIFSSRANPNDSWISRKLFRGNMKNRKCACVHAKKPEIQPGSWMFEYANMCRLWVSLCRFALEQGKKH